MFYTCHVLLNCYELSNYLHKTAYKSVWEHKHVRYLLQAIYENSSVHPGVSIIINKNVWEEKSANCIINSVSHL